MSRIESQLQDAKARAAALVKQIATCQSELAQENDLIAALEAGLSKKPAADVHGR